MHTHLFLRFIFPGAKSDPSARVRRTRRPLVRAVPVPQTNLYVWWTDRILFTEVGVDDKVVFDNL